MNPIAFPEQNLRLLPPAGDPNCGTLDAFTDGRTVVSCWQPTPHEVAAIVAGEPVWLLVWSGSTAPPVMVQTERPFAGRAEAVAS